MADDDDKKTDEKEDKTDPWEKLTGVVRSVIKEEIAAWQPQSQGSEKQEKDEKETEKETEKKPERRRGFLEDFFKGLTD